MYNPLQITAWLGTPVAGDDWLPLDGILLHTVIAERGEFVYTATPGQTRPYAADVLPIERRGLGDDWYYAASFVRWPETSYKGTDYWNKRFDAPYAEVFGQSVAAKANPKTGVYKNRHQILQYRHATTLTWYAFGDGDEIQRLLNLVCHIGKKRHIGFGYVTHWQVDEIGQDFSCFDGHNNPTRPIPVSSVPFRGRMPSASIGIRPPYYGLDNYRTCYVPRGAMSGRS